MTHEKFIELLNLYLDGELPPHETAVLEQEIAGNPEHRRIYRQYCQIQNACGELAERFREEAAPAPFFRQGRVVELGRRTSGEWIRSIALVASGAVAAGVVFVAIQRIGPQEAGALAGTQSPASTPALQTTTVALGGNPAGFRNPWSAKNPDLVVDFARLTPTPVDLTKPIGSEELKLDLQPYGPGPGSPLRSEEIEAAAFQYQR